MTAQSGAVGVLEAKDTATRSPQPPMSPEAAWKAGGPSDYNSVCARFIPLIGSFDPRKESLTFAWFQEQLKATPQHLYSVIERLEREGWIEVVEPGKVWRRSNKPYRAPGTEPPAARRPRAVSLAEPPRLAPVASLPAASTLPRPPAIAKEGSTTRTATKAAIPERRGEVAEQATASKTRATCLLCPEKAGSHGLCSKHQNRFYPWRAMKGGKGGVTEQQVRDYVAHVLSQGAQGNGARKLGRKPAAKSASPAASRQTGKARDKKSLKKVTRTSARANGHADPMALACALVKALRTPGHSCTDPHHDDLESKVRAMQGELKRLQKLEKRVNSLVGRT